MSWFSDLFKSKDKGAAKKSEVAATAAQQAQLDTQNAQTAQVTQTLAALLGSQTAPPVINFPKLPKVARAPSQIDPEVAAAQLRRAKRRTGGRTGSQSTGLVKRV